MTVVERDIRPMSGVKSKAKIHIPLVSVYLTLRIDPSLT